MSDFETRWREVISGEAGDWWAPLARGGLGALAGLYAGVVGGYRLGFDLRLLHAASLPCRVVSIGNITVGGTGKTTTTRWLVRRLQEWGRRPAILSHGYRAGEAAETKQERPPVTVVSDSHQVLAPVETSGDEPQLLARSLPGVPVLIGRKRVLTARHAYEQLGVDTCVVDDGFQYWRLKKDLEIVLLNATNPFGYGRLVPRGMLREPLRGLRRAHAAILTHAARVEPSERDKLRAQIRKLNPHLVLAEARHVPVCLREAATGARLPLESLREGRWLALSSLGSPESFERTLVELGARNPAPARFRDHHPYRREELAQVVQQVTREGLSGVVTTEKDFVKIPVEWLAGTDYRVLEVDLELLSGRDELEALVRTRVGIENGSTAR
ncbi:MAG: tetraacyldisaccharide 4'-kinase [Armatimonadota bacterium]